MWKIDTKGLLQIFDLTHALHLNRHLRRYLFVVFYVFDLAVNLKAGLHINKNSFKFYSCSVVMLSIFPSTESRKKC